MVTGGRSITSMLTGAEVAVLPQTLLAVAVRSYVPGARLVTTMKYGGPLVTWPKLFVPEKNSTWPMALPRSWASASRVTSAGTTNTEPLVGLMMLTLGCVVLMTVTVWLQLLLLPQASVASQV